MMMTVMIAHAAVSAKPSLRLTRIGQTVVSATPSSRPRHRLGHAIVSHAVVSAKPP
jgi:hypothetical protein